MGFDQESAFFFRHHTLLRKILGKVDYKQARWLYLDQHDQPRAQPPSFNAVEHRKQLTSKRFQADHHIKIRNDAQGFSVSAESLARIRQNLQLRMEVGEGIDPALSLGLLDIGPKKIRLLWEAGKRTVDDLSNDMEVKGIGPGTRARICMSRSQPRQLSLSL